MNESECVNVDLSIYQKTVFNTMFFVKEDAEKIVEDYYITDNKFGWNVSRAEIVQRRVDKRLIEYMLFSVNGIEQAHAKLIETKELIYWRYEFLGRELPYSPDLFEPSLSDFLEFYYNNTPLIFRQQFYRNPIVH